MAKLTRPPEEAGGSTIRALAAATRAGRLNRREFLALASIFGASAAGAYALIGVPLPARAQDDAPRRGGTLRIGMRVMDISDPRVFDWTEMSNVARMFCETLVRWEPDHTLSPQLLESWEVSEDARTYTLRVRRGATWNNGDIFDAEDVIFNIRRWCDTAKEGNSMAARMTSLIDPETGQLAEGVVEKVDDYTIRISLQRPDITLIPSFSDYPALIVHRDFDSTGNLAESPIGTGPFELVEIEIGARAQVKRRESGWWGGEVFLDGVEFLDYGTDQATIASAFEAEEIHVNDETPADYVEIMDGLGLERKETTTGATVVCRMNITQPPYDDPRVRTALQRAVDNSKVLALALGGLGAVAENHHVGPMHPEYAALPPVEADPELSRTLLAEAGRVDEEFELISLDGDWQFETANAVAGQLRDGGIKVNRTVFPGATFWNNWTSYPFSTTDWGARPLGVQNLALAYRSGEAWNETGFANAEFDAKLDEALGVFDPDVRREIMVDLETILQDSGIIIQPFWRNIYLHHTPAVKGYERAPAREIYLERVWLDE